MTSFCKFISIFLLIFYTEVTRCLTSIKILNFKSKVRNLPTLRTSNDNIELDTLNILRTEVEKRKSALIAAEIAFYQLENKLFPSNNSKSNNQINYEN